MNKKPVLATT